MTYYSKVGIFQPKSSTGSQSITDVGFTPSAVIIWGVGSYGGSNTYSPFHIGFGAQNSDSTYSSGYIAVAGKHNVATSVEGRRYSASAVIGYVYWDGTLAAEATLTSFDTDGFTLNWTTSAGAAMYYNYLALGGTDITKAKVVNWQNRSGTGSQSVTTPGFKPDLVVHMGVETTGTSPTTGTSSSYQIGAMDSAGNQWATYGFGTHNVKPSVTGRIQVTDGCIIGTGRSTSVDHKAAFTSMDTNGFTINWTSYLSQQYYISLCLQGGAYTVGNLTKNTTTVVPVLDHAVFNFTPASMFFLTDSHVASGSEQTGQRLSIGASDGKVSSSGVSTTLSAGITNRNGITPTVAYRYLEGNSVSVADNDSEALDAVAIVAGLGYGSTSSPLTPTNSGVHEGIAYDGTYYYSTVFSGASNESAIYKYDSSWNLVASRLNAGTLAGIDDLCGCDCYDGQLYIAATDTVYSTGGYIAIFNTSDLSFVQTISGPHTQFGATDSSGLGIDSVNGIIYISSFGAGTIWKYNLADFSYIGKITPSPLLNNGSATGNCPQDVKYYNGSLYVPYSYRTGGTTYPTGGVVKMAIDGTGQDYSAVPDLSYSNATMEIEGCFVDANGIHLMIDYSVLGYGIIYRFSSTTGFSLWWNTNNTVATQICFIAFGAVSTGGVTATTELFTANTALVGVDAPGVMRSINLAANVPSINVSVVIVGVTSTTEVFTANVPRGFAVTGVTATESFTANVPTILSNVIVAGIAANGVFIAKAPPAGVINTNTSFYTVILPASGDINIGPFDTETYAPKVRLTHSTTTGVTMAILPSGSPVYNPVTSPDREVIDEDTYFHLINIGEEDDTITVQPVYCIILEE